ncbi:MAG TPA: nucleotidyltransferase family protein [Casimicrobiaceae bacterium]|jgi:MurNAc alpha-1-phosphate uridylyltransferase|nr:nucleotidyltransferase family protein [Casimicrobiaceae bacterium]
MASAMILAAGRGERMRPLSDTLPKPLLVAGGKPLVVWQIEALARAGFVDIVINVSPHADKMIKALGDGRALGVAIRYSREATPLETAGGIATALPLLARGPVAIVSGDVWSDFDYARLAARAQHMAADPGAPRAHLVMVANPPYHAQGDFVLDAGQLRLTGGPRLTYANLSVHDTALFAELPPHTPLKLLPLWRDWIARGLVSGELHQGRWTNVGTPADLMQLDAELASRPGGNT